VSDDGWVHSCRYELQPAQHADRDAGYQYHMTPATTWVLGSLTMTRSTTEAVYALKDDVLTTYTEGGKQTATMAGPAEYRRVAAEIFGLPALPIDDGLAALAIHRNGNATG
jgi:arylamine N-acetyltransferase